LIEYAHRALASAVGLLVLALAALAVRRHRDERAIVRASVGAAVLVVAQGLLGAVTVERNLDPVLVAAHLGLAMALVALLLLVLRASDPAPARSPAPPPGPGLRGLSLAVPALVLLTVVAGGYMAGTEKHGRTDFQPSAGAHYACGFEFPACNGALFPFGQTALADVHLTHRFFMYVASVALLGLVVMVVRRRPSAALVRTAWWSLVLLVLQIALGAANVWIPTEYEALIVAHLSVATALWSCVVWLALGLRPAPAPAASRPARRQGDAVVA
jgi:heme A synthase